MQLINFSLFLYVLYIEMIFSFYSIFSKQKKRENYNLYNIKAKIQTFSCFWIMMVLQIVIFSFCMQKSLIWNFQISKTNNKQTAKVNLSVEMLWMVEEKIRVWGLQRHSLFSRKMQWEKGCWQNSVCLFVKLKF